MSAFWVLIIAANCCTMMSIILGGLREHAASLTVALVAVGLSLGAVVLLVGGAA